MITPAELIEKLNNLISINIDGMNGYKNAIENVDNPTLKEIFTNRFKQRSSFIQELRSEVFAFGGTPTQEGSTAAKLHRSWMDLKGLVTGNDEEAILKACEVGEEFAKETYDLFLADADLSPRLITLLTMQRTSISKSLSQVGRLEEIYS